ncbi:unnamed protein product [Pieris macdunnoughi]|uniref:Uncharacterized protein n=1 Tax=Pieris macdunnoughi TaxID=345717 RepID=A0A821T944_9NEOP|nr:unnamed protein product [Pieris macdunnoughi]
MTLNKTKPLSTLYTRRHERHNVGARRCASFTSCGCGLRLALLPLPRFLSIFGARVKGHEEARREYKKTLLSRSLTDHFVENYFTVWTRAEWSNELCMAFINFYQMEPII